MRSRVKTGFIAWLFLAAQGCEGNLPARHATDAEPPQVSPAIPTIAEPPVSVSPELPPEFDPLPLRIGAAKAKDLLTGLALTDDELGKLADPTAFAALADAWMGTPQFDQVMLQFFADVFQQRPFSYQDMKDYALGFSMYAYITNNEAPKLKVALEEMFARTALGIVQEGRSFTEVATTTRFKLNVPLMASLLFLDTNRRFDDGGYAEQDFSVLKKFPNFRFVGTKNLDLAGVSTPIPFEDTINPNHPNFTHWYDTNPNAFDPYWACPDNPANYCKTGAAGVEDSFQALFGRFLDGTDQISHFSKEDWATWKWVTIRKAAPSETPTFFLSVPAFRTTSEIVVETPRVGFFSTPAFFAHWPTNATNSFRVTTNQALIVGIGHSLTDTKIVPAVRESASESEHVKPGSPCYGCHQTMDPIRDMLRHDFAGTGMPRPGSAAVVGDGVFAFAGSTPVTGRGVETLGKAIAEHPDFAKSWAQKLCVWANANPCVEDDPEFLRVVEVFRASNHNFKVLLRELLTSPLSTFASRTRSSDRNGVAMHVAQRETFCQRMSLRTNRNVDLCDLHTAFGEYDTNGHPQTVYTQGIPQTDYARGVTVAAVPEDPGILFQPSVTRMCAHLAEHLVDAGDEFGAEGDRFWVTSDVPKALDEFVTLVMGVPKSDPLFAELRAPLAVHHEKALALAIELPHNTVAKQALRSTFIVACSSPLAASNGL